jgi:hypothetical protein
LTGKNPSNCDSYQSTIFETSIFIQESNILTYCIKIIFREKAINTGFSMHSKIIKNANKGCEICYTFAVQFKTRKI